MYVTFGVAAAIATATDAATLISTIAENLVANLPFIFAVVGFGIVLRLVLKKVNKPLK